jgi:DNA-binding MarR family transcriptional regulator
MAQDRVNSPATSAPVEQRWADLADLILVVAREIQFRGYSDEVAQSLSQSEGMVMRFLASDASAAPTRIAAATGLQRTNLSAVLRDLEKKGLIERRVCPADRRGVTVHRTERGARNYALVRKEWAASVSAAAEGDTTNLDAALSLLTSVETGLIKMRPRTAGGPDRDAAARRDTNPKKIP